MMGANHFGGLALDLPWVCGALTLRGFSLVDVDSGFALVDKGQSLLGGFTLMTEYHLLRSFAFTASCVCHWQTLPCVWEPVN